FDTPGVGGREVEEVESDNGQIEQERTRTVGRIHGLEFRVIQIAHVPAGEFVGKPNNPIGPLRLRNSRHNDARELVWSTVLQVRVHGQDDGIVLTIRKLLQPGCVGATVILKGDGDTTAGRLPTRVWRGNKPV